MMIDLDLKRIYSIYFVELLNALTAAEYLIIGFIEGHTCPSTIACLRLEGKLRSYTTFNI